MSKDKVKDKKFDDEKEDDEIDLRKPVIRGEVRRPKKINPRNWEQFEEDDEE